jgi:hypothetical protein
MKAFKLASLVLCVLLLTSCAPKLISKGDAYPDCYKEVPQSILVLPPINESTAADAKDFYSTTIMDPLAFAGYYVFPIEVVTEILKKEGLADTEMLMNAPPQKFKEYFGADAVLYVKILKWDTVYFVLGGNVTVAIDSELKSTTTGKTLWKYDGSLTVDTTAQDRNVPGIAGLILKLIETAAKTAAQDYVPIARTVNYMVLGSMPFGKYHKQHGQDKGFEVVMEEKVKPKEQKK